ncbi:rod shape-determining protein MreD [Amphibacillus marinus]|uniref:Rod shape-determining protein MreD n=1 Tax=Amphibacillus marinus TaxID=872970 RepID=A0A1H8P3G5_9BACI|nr:rod shape-determining protein MreD [Amphibacillus marinus]SEO36083.1 rod shape-determining protein MreD [Amphibacillus marinus]
MSRLYLPFILLLLIALQGTTAAFIPNFLLEHGWIIVFHSVFVFLVLFTLFYDLEHTYYSLFFAILSGVLIDIVYTSVVGVYMFSYAITIYFVHGMRKLLHANFFVALLLTVVGIAMADYVLYFIYLFTGFTNIEALDYFYYRMLPTVLINTLIFLLFYLIFKRKLVKWSELRFEKKGSIN